MVGSGVNLVDSLEHLAKDESLLFSEAVGKVHKDVARGATFSHALKQHPRIFPPVCSNLVRAAEQTGTLHLTLERLAEYLADSAHLERRLKAATLYPLIVLVLLLIMITITVRFVFPSERALLESLGAKMPMFTELLFGGLSLLFHPFVLGTVAVVVLGAFRYYTGGEQVRPQLFWRRLVDSNILKLPAVGGLVFKIAASRALAIFANLLDAGATIDQAMVYAAPLTGNVELEQRLVKAKSALMNGSTFSEALERHQVFPPLAIHLLKVAEESGGMPGLCHRLADIFEHEVEDTLDTASTLVEPLTLLFVGAFVGLVLLATLLPTVDIVGKL